MNDPQLAAALPDPDVTAVMLREGMTSADVVRTALEGYANRPALGERAVEFVTDPRTGRTRAELLPYFETITYGEVWQRARRLAADWARERTLIGERVAVLGFPGSDYTVVEVAAILSRAVSVPLPAGASVDVIRSIVAETQPAVIATGIEYLTQLVDVLSTGHGPRRILVFNFRPEVDDHRDAYDAAVERLATTAPAIRFVTFREATASAAPTTPDRSRPAHDDDLAVVIYTSGSTGSPKGVMYPCRTVSRLWTQAAGFGLPAIALTYLPMSHTGGRASVFGALGSGGTVYFTAAPDLSTFLDDLAVVRPTQLLFVPRIWDMIHTEYLTRLNAVDPDMRTAETEEQVLRDLRVNRIGGRYIAAITGSAPMSPEMMDWANRLLDTHVIEGYGMTEAGQVTIDGYVRRPPITDYRLDDVPGLGYFATDQPHPRGELLIKSTDLFLGYYNQPDLTATVFDDNGFYRTGDIVAETAPDRLLYVDRRNDVIKLSQGEFVAISRLEALYADIPLIHQIFLYGNGSRPYLLAVVVPSPGRLDSEPDAARLKDAIRQAIQQTAAAAGLRGYEIPRDVLIAGSPFTVDNGLLTGIGKLARRNLKQRYETRLEALYTELTRRQDSELRALRSGGAELGALEAIRRVVSAVLGIAVDDIGPDAHFVDLGGDSLNAVTFAELLHEVCGVEIPLTVLANPASSLGDLASYLDRRRSRSDTSPDFDSVHIRRTGDVRADELTLEKFIDVETLVAARSLPKPVADIRHVLLTGATGYLGRFLLLTWLDRMRDIGGTVTCLVRGRDDTAARARLDGVFDEADAEAGRRYRLLADGHLDVLAGDKGERHLGLDSARWHGLAESVDLIVDPAALVNHMLPYEHLFGPNVIGTAELLRLAITGRVKHFHHVSTLAVGVLDTVAGADVEGDDIRTASPRRAINDGYANGYATSKWAGEVLLREAHDLCAMPTAVFRCGMIMADEDSAGPINTGDVVTRILLSIAATGLAPESFHGLDPDGARQRSHFDGLPVGFVSSAITAIGAATRAGFETYHVTNSHDDGIGLDTYVDWVIDGGYPVRRISGYDAWYARICSALRALPEKQRRASLLPLMEAYRYPSPPMPPILLPSDRFRAAVQRLRVTDDGEVPHITAPIIATYCRALEAAELVNGVGRH